MAYKYKLLNSKTYKNRRKRLRASSTESENIVWKIVRRKQLGHYFRRQYSIGAFIVDFCCPKLKLIIEIDGETHHSENAYKRDLDRENYLKNFGFVIKRYPAEYVLKNEEGVYYDLMELCDKILLSKPSPNPLP